MLTVSEMEWRGERMRASGVRMSDAIGTACNQKGVRGCGTALTIDWRLAEE